MTITRKTIKIPLIEAAAATNDAKKAAERDTKKVIEREPREPGNIINNYHELIFVKYDHFF